MMRQVMRETLVGALIGGFFAPVSIFACCSVRVDPSVFSSVLLVVTGIGFFGMGLLSALRALYVAARGGFADPDAPAPTAIPTDAAPADPRESP